ncbi:MAG: deaminase [Candidatus Spechtbacterales bacterium]|nr:deaminase [Candidatus Spechtbacterales bacterium]
MGFMDNRPSWDATFMAKALDMAKRANCMKKVEVGAVIVKNKREIASGYNGAPPGFSTCQQNHECLIIEEMGSSCQRVLHAEQNAILQNSAMCRNATLYITHFPCIVCMRQIIAVGINRIVYLEVYKPDHYKARYELAKEMAEVAKIELSQLSRNDAFAIINSRFRDVEKLEGQVDDLEYYEEFR